MNRIAGDQTCKAWLADTENSLKRLTEQVNQLETSRQKAIDAYHALDKEWRSAQDAKERSGQRKTEALAIWEEKEVLLRSQICQT